MKKEAFITVYNDYSNVVEDLEKLSIFYQKRLKEIGEQQLKVKGDQAQFSIYSGLLIAYETALKNNTDLIAKYSL